ncbi:MAG: alanine--tRNA ligase-related protein [Patescibacteria group bacterium]
MELTKLLYLEDFNLLNTQAKVIDMFEENGKNIVLLHQTIFYPQGGGQPYDKGVIESTSGKFIVEEVRFADGAVKHIGRFESGNFSKGEDVQCIVDKERRILHSRLHSAGHIVDMAVTKLKLSWVPGKGFHFPEGPYVEYKGDLEGVDKENLKIEIEKLCNAFIQEGRKTELRFMPKEEMGSVCHFVPDYIPEGKPARVVMYGDFGVPCGGTHVSDLAEIKSMTIRKIKQEGENIRVGYDVER